MKQVIFNFGELSIVCNIGSYCYIYKAGIPLWMGDKDELVELLKKVKP